MARHEKGGTNKIEYMKVLIACEESQTVCKAFRAKGHEAYSCDIQECSGGHPEWHIQENILNQLSDFWDMMIAFPPCTFLTTTANRHFINNPRRWESRVDAMKLVYKLLNAPIRKIALENPKGVISSHIRKPDQYIHPYYFGDPEPKLTGLWLKNLPLLEPTNIIEPEYVLYKNKKSKTGFSKYGKITGTHPSTNNPENAKLRSKTFQGIADAMAEQWG